MKKLRKERKKIKKKKKKKENNKQLELEYPKRFVQQCALCVCVCVCVCVTVAKLKHGSICLGRGDAVSFTAIFITLPLLLGLQLYSSARCRKTC